MQTNIDILTSDAVSDADVTKLPPKVLPFRQLSAAADIVPPSGTEPVNQSGDAASPDVVLTTPPSARTCDNEGGEGGEEALAPPSPPSRAPSPRSVGSTPATYGLFTARPRENPVVTALREANLYLATANSGRHDAVCPWAEEHRPGSTAETIYSEPDMLHAIGSFSCSHDHAEAPHIGSLLDYLHVDPDSARGKPVIRIKRGEIHRLVGLTEGVLATAGGYYQSGGAIVTVSTDPSNGDIMTVAVSDPALTVALSAEADFLSYDGRAKAWLRSDVPPRLVSSLLKSGRYDALPVLKGLARQPYFRRGDYSLVTAPGYDAESGIYATFDPSKFPLPEPTRDNALAALKRLNDLVEEFFFASAEDRAASLCAMLTASVREFLPLAPAFNITASMPGSGKSYLATVIAPFAGPGQARNVSYPTNNEEATKVVHSLAMEQPAVICFDDMPGDWLPFGAINKMLTSGTISERLLGSSRMVNARTASLVIGTGNNIRPLRDLARRVVSIYLAPQAEVAATLRYTGRPAQAVRDDRGGYVSDALTIIRAWLAAGKPKADLPNIGSFELWSDLCREPLVWLGQPDPATSLIEQVTHDPDAEALGALFAAWINCFGTSPTTLRKLLDRAESEGELKESIYELPVIERGVINRSRLGRYLARNANRIVNGLRLQQTPTQERNAWSVIRLGGDRKEEASPSSPPFNEREAAMNADYIARGMPPLEKDESGEIF